jgi:hypothetical protein
MSRTTTLAETKRQVLISGKRSAGRKTNGWRVIPSRIRILRSDDATPDVHHVVTDPLPIPMVLGRTMPPDIDEAKEHS